MSPSIGETVKDLVATPSVFARARKACAQVDYKGYACASLKSRSLTLDLVTMFFETGQFVPPASAARSAVSLEPIIEDAVHDALRLQDMRKLVADTVELICEKFPKTSQPTVRREVKSCLANVMQREFARADRSMPLDVLSGMDVVVAHVPGLRGFEPLKSLKTDYYDEFRDAASIKPNAAFERLLRLANVSSQEYIAAVEEMRGERLDDPGSVRKAVASDWAALEVLVDSARPQLVSPSELVNSVDAAPNGFVPMVAFAVDAAYLCRGWRSKPHGVEGGVLALHDFETGTGCPVRFEEDVDLSDFPGGLVQAEGVPCDFRESYGYSEEEFQSRVTVSRKQERNSDRSRNMNDDIKRTIDRIKKENPALVEELTALVLAADAHGSLDESVYDYFGEIGSEEANAHESSDGQEKELVSSEAAAAEINNAGAEEQICIILDGHGVADGERLIKDLIGDPAPKM
ncbi:hypothetical protein [Roseibium sp. RKSG952]|uniref:hypothetical protein n=1 Tax=Roseibium sp. RKSG952 TaxID=2529384 RepID=UPI0012BD7812|nr:hypothetical protein [Roseibium sp. RKSG952]MTH95451.1 hypothetical protein [Roseibium sp. RKSG952]